METACAGESLKLIQTTCQSPYNGNGNEERRQVERKSIFLSRPPPDFFRPISSSLIESRRAPADQSVGTARIDRAGATGAECGSGARERNGRNSLGCGLFLILGSRRADLASSRGGRQPPTCRSAGWTGGAILVCPFGKPEPTSVGAASAQEARGPRKPRMDIRRSAAGRRNPGRRTRIRRQGSGLSTQRLEWPT